MVSLENMMKIFGELTKQEKLALFEAWLDGKEIEVARHQRPDFWATAPEPAWMTSSCYRVKSVPLTKPSIDWSAVSKEYKYLARDSSGEGYLYNEISSFQRIGIKCWYGLNATSVNPFKSYVQGTCDWTDSLIQRPEGV